MNTSPGVPILTRKVAVVAALIIGLAAVATTLVVNQQDVSAADSGKSNKFTTVGSGDLPTSKPKLNAVRDSLSADETGYAIHLASTDSSIPAGATDVLGKAGPEFLYADLPEGDFDATARKAVVVLYDYTSNTAYNQVVDLTAGKVLKSTTADGLQPPTSTTEADVAVQLAINATETLPFKAEFEAAQGVPLISPKQVDYVAGAWVFDGTTATGKECGEDRCAQLMLSTGSGAYLGTVDFVVNLTTQSIVAIK
ncbi:MAG: hypothetical protein ABWX74_20730 [Aeromicrobium sp.]